MRWTETTGRLLKQVAEIIKSLDAWQKSNEEVVVTAKWKDNGEYRAISNFGFEHRTRQYLVADFLSSIALLHPDQYGTRGGVPAAIDRVSELLRAGYVWTIELDIANCFPSFEGKNLHNFLPLPEKVIAHTIMGDTLNVVPADNLLKDFGPAEDDPGQSCMAWVRFSAAARRGLPQGSAAASIVAEMLIAVPLKTLPSVGRVPSYADNMLIMAKSEEDAVSMSTALLSAFKAHPVGHLTPTLKSQSRPGQWVHFLGHCLRVDGQAVQIVPSPKNEAKFAKRVKPGLKSVGNTHLSGYVRRARARGVQRDIKSWTANFCRCEGMAERKKHWLGKIDAAIGAIGK